MSLFCDRAYVNLAFKVGLIEQLFNSVSTVYNDLFILYIFYNIKL